MRLRTTDESGFMSTNPQPTHPIHWMPLTPDLAYNRQVADAAAACGADAVHLSHLICHHAEELLDEDRAAHARALCGLYREKGLDVWCWTHEFSHDADVLADAEGRLPWDEGVLDAFLQEKYARFLNETLPGLSGLVLTFAETPYAVYQDKRVESTLPPEERTARLIEWMRDICRTHGVQLAVRDFVYRLPEVEGMIQTLRRMPDDVIVMSKCVPHDWHPFYPANPVLGALGEKTQWIEHDLGYEYEGQHAYPYCDLDCLVERVREGRTRGGHALCLRLDRYHGDTGQSAVSTPWGRLALQVAQAVHQNPEVDVDALVRAWEADTVPGAANILHEATEAVKKMLFPKHMWIADHSRIPSYAYAKSHLNDGNADRLSIWTDAPDDHATDAAFRGMDAAFVQALDDEADEACAHAARAMALYKESGVDDPSWSAGLKALGAWMEIWQAWRAAFFRLREEEEHLGTHPEAVLAEWIDAFESVTHRFAEWLQTLSAEGRVTMPGGQPSYFEFAPAWKARGSDPDALPFAKNVGNLRHTLRVLKERSTG